MVLSQVFAGSLNLHLSPYIKGACVEGFTMSEQIICIFCGKKADTAKRNGKLVVFCPHCIRVTDGNTYQEMFDQWLCDVRERES